LEIDPIDVDVNVHPRKLELRFAHKNEIYELVKNAVKALLQKANLNPQISGEARSYWNTEKLFKSQNSGLGTQNLGFRGQNVGVENSKVQDALKFTQNFLKQDNDLEKNIDNQKYVFQEQNGFPVKVIGQIHNAYILVEDDDGLMIIDQHAAHERIMYEKLILNIEKEVPESQLLLIPLILELTVSEMAILNEYKEIFEKIGFEIENFEGESFKISAVPLVISNTDIKSVILGIIDDLKDEKKVKKILDPQHEIICYTACRSAIKFGQTLTLIEQIALITELEKQAQKATCPHGRPVKIHLSSFELEKRFGRR
jgi:DNA mismatch repair protein MutL